MKAYGQMINAMAKEPTGEMKMENLEESTLEIGMKTRNMVEVHSFTKMVTDMMVIGLKVCLRAKAEWFMKIKIFMKDNGISERETVMEF